MSGEGHRKGASNSTGIISIYVSCGGGYMEMHSVTHLQLHKYVYIPK